MKILVLSDSHSSRFPMRRFLEQVKPQAVIHLGDHYEDGAVLQEENPHLRFYLLPGNCDRFRCPPDTRQFLCCRVGGPMIFMTHGHMHMVKSGTGALIADARRYGAAAALYGHTHRAECRQLEDGMWLLNPGCSGSAGVIETDGEKITACYLLEQA